MEPLINGIQSVLVDITNQMFNISTIVPDHMQDRTQLFEYNLQYGRIFVKLFAEIIFGYALIHK